MGLYDNVTVPSPPAWIEGDSIRETTLQLLDDLHIPVEGDHPFQSKATTDSDRRRPLIPA
jgi:hypothetical protein